MKQKKLEALLSEAKAEVEDHKLAAMHHEQAAKYHRETARLHEEGNHEEAFECKERAHKYSWGAQEYEMNDKEQHALLDFYNILISHLFI